MKNYIALCSLLLISINFQDIKSESIDSIDDIPEIAPITTEATDSTTSSPCPTVSADDILNFITPACNSEENPPLVNIIPLLSKNIYKKTAGPVLRRSLLDEPSLQPYIFGDICSWSVTAQPFYNVTPKVKFSKTSHLDNYLNLNTKKGFFKEITKIRNEIETLFGETSNFSLDGAINLIKPVKLQQHRAGAMFYFDRMGDCFYFSYRIPLYYLVEHLHLTNKEIEKIKKSDFFTSSEPTIADFGTEEDGDRFLRKHFSTDTVGLGDSRIILQLVPYKNEKFKLWTGAQITAPTAKRFHSGMLGEEIDFCAPNPTIDIEKLASLALCPTEPAKREAHRILANNLTDFGIQFIDRLSTILINTPLGNGKHWGIGPQIDFTYQFNNCWSTHGTAIFEWLASHREKRFFIKIPSKSVLNQCFRDAENPTEKLNLIGELAVNTLFPTPITVGVRPGYLIKIRQLVRFDTNLWNFSLGLDYWREGHEKFMNIRLPVESYKAEYAIKKALHKSADQLKLYGSLGYHEEIPNKALAWFALFTWDAAVWSRDIGQNFTAGVQCGINF